MLTDAIIKLALRIGPQIAANWPEFQALVEQAKLVVNGADQARLDKALELAADRSDSTHFELQRLLGNNTD